MGSGGPFKEALLLPAECLAIRRLALPPRSAPKSQVLVLEGLAAAQVAIGDP